MKKFLKAIIEIVIFILLLEAGLWTGKAIFIVSQNLRNHTSLARKGSVRIMCLGESTTADGGEYSYPSQLEKILNDYDSGIHFSVINKGVNGVTTSYILAHLEENIKRYKPDIVVTMMGAGDEGPLVPIRSTVQSPTQRFLNNFKSYKLLHLLWAIISKNNELYGIPIHRKYLSENPAFVPNLVVSENGQNNIVSKAATTKARHMFLQAMKFKKMKQYKLTEALLNRSIYFSPDYEEAYYELGVLYMLLERFTEAETALRKAISLNQNKFEYYEDLGRCCRYLQKNEEARSAFEIASTLKPNDAEPYRLLGEIFIDTYQYDSALLMLKNSLHLDPNVAGTYVMLGKLSFLKGMYQEAEDYFLQAIKIVPNDSCAYKELARFYKDIGDFNRAETQLIAVTSLFPEDIAGYIDLGDFYRINGKMEKALEQYSRAVEVDPGNPLGYIGKAFYYKWADRWDEAIYLLKKAALIRPGSVAASYAYEELAVTYRENSLFDKEIEMMRKAISINPRSTYAWRELGIAYLKQQQYEQSKEAFQNALKLNPLLDRAIGGLLTVYHQTQSQRAYEEYARCIHIVKAGYYNPVTRHNYRKLRNILKKHGIGLICVQYPMRSVSDLKKLFEGDESGLVFVDNEKSFKNAVEHEGYREYFVDMTMGDFGHCSAKGNRVIAENIASAFIKHYLNSDKLFHLGKRSL